MDCLFSIVFTKNIDRIMNMAKFNSTKRHINNYLFDHRGASLTIQYLFSFLICVISPLIYAFGFSAFITGYESSPNLVTGGLSGICQSLILLLQLCGVRTLDFSTMQSIMYFILNIPLLIFAFIKLSKRFAICTAINVGLSSLFIYLFSISGFTQAIGSSEFLKNSPLSRALFAGICVGTSSSLAYMFDVSCGGFDVISYYLNRKKSTGAGKIGTIMSSVCVTIYLILLLCANPTNWSQSLIIIFFSITYLFVNGLVVDAINVKNKKIEIKIITSNHDMTTILISLFPHSMTVIKGEGAYSREEKEVIELVVISSEVNQVVNVIKKADPNAFVITSNVNKIIGHFFTNPLE